MQIIIFALIALSAIVLNILTAQGFFNVKDKLLWKQTTNLISQQQPVKLEIPSVKIESSVERVGIDSQGNMQAPSSASIISWYQFGALPGEKGNIVLSGHKDSTFGLGVFYTLEKTKPGDKIKITDVKNKEFTYSVQFNDQYLSSDLPISEIFADQKKQAKIYLITCAGSFDFFTKKYDKRILVEGILD
jgi:LPXTG-site transpeptidase (sortase) family protein